MAKFSSKTAVRPRPVKGPVTTTLPKSTYNGGLGFGRDAKSDLFLLAVTNMVGENTYYESAEDRDARFISLVHAVTKEDPEWVAGFIPYLRTEMFMRSASLVAAAEYVAAGGPHGSAVVDSALQRADEPAELLAYWHTFHGRNEPKAIKRGVAKAVKRLYNEYSALKYDGQSRGFRMGDVIERVHPTARDLTQGAVYEYLLDRRHHGKTKPELLAQLPRIKAAVALDALTEGELRAVLAERGAEALSEAGYTWERLSGKIGMDAQAWETIIPSMGYMALLRNLRNFTQAGINKTSERYVRDYLSDPDKVAKSMQFPYRFYSAYKATGDLKYAQALEEGLDYSTQNIPELAGRSLILVDVSGSMQQNGYGRGDRSAVAPWEKGALFGVAQFLRAENADLVAFATRSKKIDLKSGTSVLRGIEQVEALVKSGSLDHGTDTWKAVEKHYSGHDRLFIFSDMQSNYHFRQGKDFKEIPSIYVFNLGGYDRTNVDLNDSGRYELGGFSDAVFRMVKLIEAKSSKAAKWPWE